MKKFVVGTDGSVNAALALRWAVDEAEIHNADVEILLVWSLLDQYHSDHSDRFDPHYGEEAAGAALASWVSEVIPDRRSVSCRTVCDLAVRALLEAGDSADLLVVGARGKGGFEGLLLGSVSDGVAQLARRPVAVVRNLAPVRGGQVVVGIDGSAASLEALRWAAREARARGGELDVVHAWHPPRISVPPVVAMIPKLETLEGRARVLLDEALADPALAGVTARGHLAAGSAARALLEQAVDASLIVVGNRGRGRMSGSLLGSVSRQLLHHASCPVVVM